MLNTAFYLLLNMSITGTIIGFIILFLRKIKAIPRTLIYFLWSLVLIRITIPVALSTEVSFLNYTGNLVKKIIKVPMVIKLPNQVELSTANYIGATKSYAPVIYKNDSLNHIYSSVATIWFIGGIVALILISLLYMYTYNEVNKKKYIPDSPMIYGIFKPKIILPVNLIDEELKYILLHEEVHIRRRDNLRRLIATLIICVHWFNPFLWIFLRNFFIDMELSCDEEVIKHLSKVDRKMYAESLINFNLGQNIFMSTGFSKTGLKSRVIRVLSYKRLSLLGQLVATIFIVLIICVLLTNPIK